MRAEDRKPSKRVFPLLQNLDLDTVTFAQVQSVGEPISIEDMNEQEMVDLIIVNLARLCVSGEWSGLLEAGGGEQAYQVPSAVCGPTGNFKYWNLATLWAGSVGGANVALNLTSEIQFFNPFIAAQTAAPVGVSIYVNTATTSQNLYIGFYESSDAGYPSTMMGYATISTDSTGAIRVTSFTEASSGSLTFEKGVQYYYSYNKSGTENPVLITGVGTECASIAPDNVVSATGLQEIGIEGQAATTSAPADISATTDIGGTGQGGNPRLHVWMDF